MKTEALQTRHTEICTDVRVAQHGGTAPSTQCSGLYVIIIHTVSSKTVKGGSFCLKWWKHSKPDGLTVYIEQNTPGIWKPVSYGPCVSSKGTLQWLRAHAGIRAHVRKHSQPSQRGLNIRQPQVVLHAFPFIKLHVLQCNALSFVSVEHYWFMPETHPAERPSWQEEHLNTPGNESSPQTVTAVVISSTGSGVMCSGIFFSAMQCCHAHRWCSWWISKRLFASPDGSLINNSSCFEYFLFALNHLDVECAILPRKAVTQILR